MQSKSKYPNTYYRVSLKAVIRNHENKVLLVKEYESNTWSLPGGGMDHGETEIEALARELCEEVGYKGGFSAKPIKAESFWLESKQSYLLWIVYDVVTENQDFSVGEYCNEVDFVDIKELKNANENAEKWIFENLS